MPCNLSSLIWFKTDERGQKDLSDEEHFMDDDHNTQYDHEAFLGKDEADRFDQLPPAEARRRLR